MSSRWSCRITRVVAVLITIAILAAPAILGAAEQTEAKLVLKKGDRLAIVGDSITEQKMYSRYMEDYLTVATPELDLWVIQLGWGGETAGGFLGRMNQDLISFKPNVATFCYGMNDGGYRPYEEGIGKRYGDAMKKIVESLKAIGAIAVVGSPGCVDTFTWKGQQAAYNESLGKLGEIDRQIAKEAGMPFADLHDRMYDVMKNAKAANGEKFPVCGGDGVHPGAAGQLIMAYAFLKGLGVSGDIGTITVEMGGQAKATDGHAVLSAKDGTVEIESTRYPFCFYGDPKSSDSTKSILPFLAFNQDLNRMTFVVKGLKGEKATITWGKESKVFSKDDLAKGINLAAEFMDNPFSDAFKKVDEEVARKQGYETFMIKDAYRTMGGLANQMKDDAEGAAAVKVIQARLLAKHEALGKAVKAAFVPVKHTITIVEGEKAAEAK
jgi:lysophospholipase L1-like esterase